jgi:uroporphyrinogen decarboxylase
MNDRFLKACRHEPVDCTPVWFMRQAGRYMKEYQAVRATRSILDVCKTPELAAQVTLQPIDRFALDAAIIFADILLPLEAMGLSLEFTEGEGPVIANPVRSRAAVDRLKLIDSDELRYVSDAIRQARRALADRVPLIGFAGAPFTLASYAIEGGGSRNYIETKSMMYREPEAWHRLMDKLARVVTGYLRQQIQAGAQAIQLFDSWVGCLSPDDYAEYVLSHVQLIFEGLRREGVPLIYFGTGTATLLPLMRRAGATVLGVDWRVHIDEAWATIGHDVAIQGNLDPVVLFAPQHEIERRVDDILRRAGGRDGHIFNLGHGILPNTPVEHVAATVDLVHKLSQGKIQN